MELRDKIRSVKDFPIKGIDFKDITTVLKEPDSFKETISQMSRVVSDLDVDIVVGMEARGFLLGTPLAYEIGAGFVPVRKPGKLPSKTVSHEYELEYGTDILEMHEDAISPGQRVLIVDDLLATGGTAEATAKMIEELGGRIVGAMFFIELEELRGRDRLSNYRVNSIVKY